MASPPRHCEVRSNPQEVGNGLYCNELTSSRSWPRGARYFCLDTKVPKKSSQQIGFFAHKPLPCKTNRTTAAIILPHFVPTHPNFCKNLLCLFLRSRPPLFYPFSPEAYLLTGTFFIYHAMDNLSKDVRRSPPTMLRWAQHDRFLNSPRNFTLQLPLLF
ncbi:MAG: hypothetical protein JWQ57_385 [Mucilaginibacter sp.]|nr:hypothetical protein [Mucilaginibacter sp.]